MKLLINFKILGRIFTLPFPDVYKTKDAVTFISFNEEFVRIDADLKPAVWHRFCFLVSKSRKDFSLIINDRTVFRAKQYPSELDQAGNLHLLGSVDQPGKARIKIIEMLRNTHYKHAKEGAKVFFFSITRLFVWNCIRP